MSQKDEQSPWEAREDDPPFPIKERFPIEEYELCRTKEEQDEFVRIWMEARAW
jgi:hypothetical protein